MAGGDPRLVAFIRALQSRGAQSVTSFPGPGGTGTSALGFTAPSGFQSPTPPLDISRLAELETAFGPGTGAAPGQSESLTGLLSSQQAAMGLGRQDGGGPSVACFPASMQVVMADGTKKSIAEVRPEEVVASWDEDRVRATVARVVKVTASAPVDDLRRIDGLIVSDWHRLAGEKRWVRAIYVKPGDPLWTANGLYEVQYVEAGLPAEPVWNLSVEPTHTFYVWDGKRAWLVHNDAGGAGAGAGADGISGDIGQATSGEIGAAAAAGIADAAAAGPVSASEAAAIGGPPGSPTGSAPGMGGGGTTSAATGDIGGGFSGAVNPATLAMLADPKASLLTAFRAADPHGEGLVKTGIVPGDASLASLAGRGIGTVAGQALGGPFGGFIGGQLGGFVGGKVGTAASVSQAANIAGFGFGGFGASAAPSAGQGPAGPLGAVTGGPAK